MKLSFIAFLNKNIMKKRQKIELKYSFFETGFGFMCAIVDEKYLYFLQFVDNMDQIYAEIKDFSIRAYAQISEGRTRVNELLEAELHQYCIGQLRDFTVPLIVYGTPFQQEVWNALFKIPFGYLTCYTRFAKDILKNDKLTRAAATAIGKNDILIIIPCHRVTTKDYRMIQNEKTRGNYKGGPGRKELLIGYEYERFMQQEEKLLQSTTSSNTDYYA